MATIELADKSISDLNLWFKIQSGDTLMLGDIPSIIPLRWSFFKTEWNFIKQRLIDNISQNDNPDYINEQIRDFENFIQSQRNTSIKINPFSDSKITHRFSGLFSILKIDDINLTNEEQKLIDQEIARVSVFSKNDFLSIKKNIIDYRDRYADMHDLSDADYNQAFGKSSIPPQVNATITDVNYILTLQNSIKSVDFILANLFAVDLSLDPFALARANANNPEVDIGQYKSGKLVKLNYGESLQLLAERYLGSADKWIDIAIANGLKPPYIDEVGQRISLLSNGDGNQINIAAVDINGQLNIDKFYINQPIFLQSTTQVVPSQRTIINLRQIPISGEIILELDGDNNLSDYKVNESAHIRVYKPNTINSSFYILIPLENELPDSRSEEVPWFLAKKSADERQAKVDLAMSDDGDLILTSNGDLKISYGLDNAVQAMKLKIVTELGSLRGHPEYGLMSIIGTTNNNVNQIKDVIIQSLTQQVAADDRYDRIEHISVNYLVNDDKTASQAVNGFSIMMSVRLAGSDTVLPISFTVNNQ